MPDAAILVINTGSSSLRLGLYAEANGEERMLFDGLAEGVGGETGTLLLRGPDGKILRSEEIKFATQGDALRAASVWLHELRPDTPVAVGHRVVHGGPRLTEHQLITLGMLNELHACVHFAPLHIPMALALIEETMRAYPHTPQFACLDTAFHRTLPQAAARFPLPPDLFDAGIRRYGFHGLSYESLVHRLGLGLPSRTVLAHLGSGASLAAVKDGKSVDTTMGLTPTGGIPMATRSGDLDPGVLLYLMRERGADADVLEQMLNHEAGLQALSGGTTDLRKLQAASDAGSPQAALAIEVFCAEIAKVVAAYATVLGGLDLLVFTGGIGEHSASVRQNVCQRLSCFRAQLDDAANQANAITVSTQESSVRIGVLPSEEDVQIARHCRRMLLESTGTP